MITYDKKIITEFFEVEPDSNIHVSLFLSKTENKIGYTNNNCNVIDEFVNFMEDNIINDTFSDEIIKKIEKYKEQIEEVNNQIVKEYFLFLLYKLIDVINASIYAQIPYIKTLVKGRGSFIKGDLIDEKLLNSHYVLDKTLKYGHVKQVEKKLLNGLLFSNNKRSNDVIPDNIQILLLKGITSNRNEFLHELNINADIEKLIIEAMIVVRILLKSYQGMLGN